MFQDGRRIGDMNASASAPKPPSGHVFRVDRKRGPAWYVKYRLSDGRQVQTQARPRLD